MITDLKFCPRVELTTKTVGHFRAIAFLRSVELSPILFMCKNHLFFFLLAQATVRARCCLVGGSLLKIGRVTIRLPAINSNLSEKMPGKVDGWLEKIAGYILFWSMLFLHRFIFLFRKIFYW